MRPLALLAALLCFTPAASADFAFVHTTDTHVGDKEDEGSNAARVSAVLEPVGPRH